ncbi:MAG: response regulator [bacterium]
MNGNTSGKTILIVDDERDLRASIKMLLEDNGYNVLSASSADEALETANANIPNLICLDIMMPGSSGIALYAKIRKEPSLKNIPVMIVSAFGQQKDFKGERFRKIIFDDQAPEPEAFMEKPIDRHKFLDVVGKLLEKV